jgi:hypothetical protein
MLLEISETLFIHTIAQSWNPECSIDVGSRVSIGRV